jgi:replication factor C subunit 3/5
LPNWKGREWIHFHDQLFFRFVFLLFFFFIISTFFHSVKLETDGLETIVKLSQGDMRKCLNILQSTHMAYGVVTAETVYACTGKPSKSDMRDVVTWLVNEDFATAVQRLSQAQQTKGLALQDIVTELFPVVLKLSASVESRTALLEALAEIEYRLASGGANDKLNLGALVGAFQIARRKWSEAKQAADAAKKSSTSKSTAMKD